MRSKNNARLVERIPFAEKCYACDSERLAGVRDFRLEGGRLEAACRRHADPTIPAQFVCIYCNRFVRAGAVSLAPNEYAHASCHREASR